MLKKLGEYFIGSVVIGAVLSVGIAIGYIARPYAESMRFLEFLESVPSTRPIQETREELQKLFPEEFGFDSLSSSKDKISGLEFELQDLELFQKNRDWFLRARCNGDLYLIQAKNKGEDNGNSNPKNMTDVYLYRVPEKKR